jgi:putative component of membrane protein insertase Oxa1/YidC/SpoIIIJ protein YidD
MKDAKKVSGQQLILSCNPGRREGLEMIPKQYSEVNYLNTKKKKKKKKKDTVTNFF